MSFSRCLSLLRYVITIIIYELVRDAQASITWQNSLSLGQCRNLRFTIDLIPGYRLKNYLIRTVDVSNEDSCQLQCYIEPNCVSYNFNKEEEANRLHRCDLNNATYQHDNETSGDLAKNQNYVYREAEVSIIWLLFVASIVKYFVGITFGSLSRSTRLSKSQCLGLNTRRTIYLTLKFITKLLFFIC